jgi:hypothetical protein
MSIDRSADWGAVCGQTNPGTLPEHAPIDIKYYPVADLRSWEVMKLFLSEVFS